MAFGWKNIAQSSALVAERSVYDSGTFTFQHRGVVGTGDVAGVPEARAPQDHGDSDVTAYLFHSTYHSVGDSGVCYSSYHNYYHRYWYGEDYPEYYSSNQRYYDTDGTIIENIHNSQVYEGTTIEPWPGTSISNSPYSAYPGVIDVGLITSSVAGYLTTLPQTSSNVVWGYINSLLSDGYFDDSFTESSSIIRAATGYVYPYIPSIVDTYEEVETLTELDVDLNSEQVKLRVYIQVDANFKEYTDTHERAFDYGYFTLFIPASPTSPVDFADTSTYVTEVVGPPNFDDIDSPVTWENSSESGVSVVWFRLPYSLTQFQSSDFVVNAGGWFNDLNSISQDDYPELFDENDDVIESMLVLNNEGKYFYEGKELYYRLRSTYLPSGSTDPDFESDIEFEPPIRDDYWRVVVKNVRKFPTELRSPSLVDNEYFRKVIRNMNSDRLSFHNFIDTEFVFDSDGNANLPTEDKIGRQSLTDVDGFEDRRSMNIIYNDVLVNGSLVLADVGSPSMNNIKPSAGLMEDQQAMLCLKRICEPVILNTRITMYDRNNNVVKEKYFDHQINYKPNEPQYYNTDEILSLLN